VKTQRKTIENARLQEENKERKKKKKQLIKQSINQQIKSDCEVNELLIRMNAEANRACKTRPCKQEYSTKKNCANWRQVGAQILSFEFEATTDREEEEEGSGPELSNLWQQTSSLARSRAAPVDKSPRRHNAASLLSPPYCATAVATWTVSMWDTCRGSRSVPPPPPPPNILGMSLSRGFF
jgi:hypothetical protein